MMIAAVMGAMLMSAIPGITAEARGQQALPMIWEQRDRPSVMPMAEEAVAVAYWRDPMAGPGHCLYVTGWGTNPVTGHTFIATYKYDVNGATEEARRVVEPAIFPPPGSPLSISAKPSEIIVDEMGTVYVVGWATNPGQGRIDTDYVILKYDKDLRSDVQFTGWASAPPYGIPGVRHYDGPVSGNDRAVDVTITSGVHPEDMLFVTGTSHGGVTGNDIVTLRIHPGSGNLVWVHRYDGAFGSDEAVRIVWYLIAAPGEGDPGAHPVVAGTSYGGSVTGFDYIGLIYKSHTGELNEVQWPPGVGPGGEGGVRRFNGPGSGNDVCTDMTGKPAIHPYQVNDYLVFCGAVTPMPGGPVDDLDYGVWCLDLGTGDTIWSNTWNGGDDEGSLDIATAVAIAPGGDVWVTGFTRQGSSYHIATTLFNQAHAPPGNLLGAHIYGDPPLVEARAVSIAASGLGGVHVGGWVFNPYADAVFVYAVLKYTFPSPSGLIDEVGIGPWGVESKPNRLIAVSELGAEGVYMTGRSGSPDHGPDFWTLRISP